MSKRLRVGLLTMLIAAVSTVAVAQSFTTFINARVTTQLDLQGTLTANGSTGTAGQFLTSNGAGDITWTTPAPGVTGATPTALVGLTAIPGSNDNNFTRSDGAPALSQAIIPTWTGTHTFANSAVGFWVQSTAPGFRMEDTDAGVDGKQWLFDINAGNFRLNARTDAGGIGSTPLQINRTGTTIDSIVLAGTAVRFNDGTASVPNIAWSLDTDTGLFRQGTNSIGFAGGGTQLGFWDENGLTLTDTFAMIRLRSTNPTSTISWYDDTGTVLRSTVGDNAGTLFVQKNNTGNIQIQTSSGNISLIPQGSGINSLSGPTQFTSTMRGAAGTAAAPSFSFTSDTDDGMYHSAANTLGFSTEGVERVTIASSGTTISGTTTMTGAVRATTLAGTAANPNIQITSASPNLGLFENDAAVDNGLWIERPVAEQLRYSACNDAGSTCTDYVRVDRTGTTVDNIRLDPKLTVGADLRGSEFVRFYNNGQGLEFSSPGGNVFDITQHDGTFYNILQLTANDLQFSDSGGTAVNMTPVKGSFTVDFTAQCSASTTRTVQYFKIGASVTLHMPVVSCTSTTSSFAASGTPVPSAIRPTASSVETMHFAVTDSSTNTHFGTILVSSTGSFTIRRCGTSPGTLGVCGDSWNASGTKSIQGGDKTITYLRY